MKTIELTRKLLKIPSESGNEELIGQFLLERLKKNFKVEIQRIGNRFNILATKGEPKLLLTTHIDTVPKQLEIKEDNEYLYGRGACDTKAIIAGMIIAGEEAREIGLKDFGILLDVSEETDFSGIKEAIKIVNPDIVIVGEPTYFNLVIGQKGLLGIKIKCYGKNAPGSMPEKGKNAIDKLVKILSDIKNIILPKDEKLGDTTLNIGKINGGTAANVVPDYAEAVIEFRTTTNNNDIIKEINSFVGSNELEILYDYEPIINNDLTFINDLSYNKIIASYFTEMYFWIKKSKTIVFGPGEYEYAHSDNEKIKKIDIEKGKECYLEIIKKFTSKESYIKQNTEDNYNGNRES
ncbi:MAG: M20/M25/M40 family metallo-hydrolase [Nanoarchaeota archaeon]